MKCQMDLGHLFKMNTGMERMVCVPALSSSSVSEHPLGPSRRSVRSGSLANAGDEILNVLQQSLDDLRRDLGSFKCVFSGGKNF